MWKVKAKDFPNPSSMWHEHEDHTEEHFHDFIGAIEKKSFDIAALQKGHYDHDAVVSDIIDDGKEQESREYFAGLVEAGLVSPAGTPTDIVKRLPKFKPEDLFSEPDEDEESTKKAGELVELEEGEEMIDESAVLEAYKKLDADGDGFGDNNSSLGLGSDTGGLDVGDKLLEESLGLNSENEGGGGI